MIHPSPADTVTILDTTLRDGEQSPGASMNLKEKLQVAALLDGLGVDVIEAGFPVASPGDFAAVKAVAEQVERAAVAALCRCQEQDIHRTAEALRPARARRIHLFLATSPIHREHKLRMTRQQVLENACAAVRMARACHCEVEFSAEDASRTEIEFLVEVYAAVVEAGATVLNVPDTVGYAVPEQFADLIRSLRLQVPGVDGVTLSVHCHNDLGLAVANSLAAIRAGARQVECTINGIGERAGNASLEELVMALKTRADFFHLRTSVRSEGLYQASRTLSDITGLEVPRNKAIVGANAFAHEAGIHQHGVLQCAATYEIMHPQEVGVPGNRLVLGKHSGRHALNAWLRERGIVADTASFEAFFHAFKRLADEHKNLSDLDLEDLWDDSTGHDRDPWRLIGITTSLRSEGPLTVTLTVATPDGQIIHEAACSSDGPSAVLAVFSRLCGQPLHLREYRFRCRWIDHRSQGEVNLEVETEGSSFRSAACHADPLEASARALCRILNRMPHATPRAQVLRATS